MNRKIRQTTMRKKRKTLAASMRELAGKAREKQRREDLIQTANELKEVKEVIRRYSKKGKMGMTACLCSFTDYKAVKKGLEKVGFAVDVGSLDLIINWENA